MALPLVATRTSVERQFAVGYPDDQLKPEGMSWEDYYVGFSGYFGSHGPHVFAAAPELLEAAREGLISVEADIEEREQSCRDAGDVLDDDAALKVFRARRDSIAAAIAKAEGR